jgi:hypothetical protein
MKAIEKAIRAELESLPELTRSSALAEVAIELAKRLDGRPADTAAVLLARELRMAISDLHQHAPEDLTNDVDLFLARIAAPDSRDAAH